MRLQDVEVIETAKTPQYLQDQTILLCFGKLLAEGPAIDCSTLSFLPAYCKLVRTVQSSSVRASDTAVVLDIILGAPPKSTSIIRSVGVYKTSTELHNHQNGLFQILFLCLSAQITCIELIFLLRTKIMSDLLTKLPGQNVEPLWTVMHSMVTPMPKPRAEPMLWRYNELRPLLDEAGRSVPTEKAERRVLMLVNPALGINSRPT